MKDLWLKIALVAVPALMSFAGSFAAVQVTLQHKASTEQVAAEVARLDRRIDGVDGKLQAHLALDDATKQQISQTLTEVKADIRALRCAQAPARGLCP